MRSTSWDNVASLSSTTLRTDVYVPRARARARCSRADRWSVPPASADGCVPEAHARRPWPPAQLQADLTLTPAFTLSDVSLGALSDYLSEVVGYFVVETIVSASTQSSYLKSTLVRSRVGGRRRNSTVGRSPSHARCSVPRARPARWTTCGTWPRAA